MPLEEYRRKRDFARTPEPAPAAAATPGAGSRTGRYVVQRHRATRLHYDFRLEVDGVLVSWAVPKGPTLDPGVRRMAVHVEDHPIEYFDFEGVIPAKQYGAGDVIVWDWGTWEGEAPTLDAAAAVEAGELKFELKGEKLKGRFTIVRTSGRRRRGDDPVRPGVRGRRRQPVAAHPQAGRRRRRGLGCRGPPPERQDRPDQRRRQGRPRRALERGGAGRQRPRSTWPAPSTPRCRQASSRCSPRWPRSPSATRTGCSRSSGTASGSRRSSTTARSASGRATSRTRRRTFRSCWPRRPGSRRARRSSTARSWRSTRRGDRISTCSRNGSATPRRPSSSTRPSTCCTSTGGRCSTSRSRIASGCSRACSSPTRGSGSRRTSSARARPSTRPPASRASRGSSPSSAGRATNRAGDRPAWLKLKVRPEQELVVGGWTPGEGNARDLGAVAVGVYEDGHLRFAGKVGSGFDGRTRRLIRERLAALETDDPPFDPAPPRDYRGRWGGELREVRWVRPELVIRAELGGWSRDGMVRQAAFKGFEPDRDPTSVSREVPVATAEAVRTAEAAEPEPAAPEASIPRRPSPRRPRPRRPGRPGKGLLGSSLPTARSGRPGHARRQLPRRPRRRPRPPASTRSRRRPTSSTPSSTWARKASGASAATTSSSPTSTSRCSMATRRSRSAS